MPCAAGPSEAARLHRLGESQATLERAGEERREERRVTAQPGGSDAAAAERLDEPARVVLERRRESRRERRHEHRAAAGRRREEPVVVEQQRVHAANARPAAVNCSASRPAVHSSSDVMSIGPSTGTIGPLQSTWYPVVWSSGERRKMEAPLTSVPQR